AFWAFAAEVFRAQGSPLRAWASQERLLTLASRTKGLDAATFEACLSTHAGETAIARDKQLVEALGLRAVPALFVAGQQVTPTVRDLRAAVRNALQNVNLGRQE
ncbi:MAG TPA: DsbA family protein, partial [Trueperaceae bacterium]